ncbi:hypothetical protein IAD21_02954 [Abditibacteriota bacterium]|nr:hypothetical protein IAD21_02954 [Abditibacteriota bacterium]
MKTLNFKKAVALTALTLAPALALTPSAQAAPTYHASVQQRSKPTPAWNNSHNNAPRFDSRPNQGQRFEPRREDTRFPNNNDNRFDPHRNDGRFDQRHDNDKNRNTGNGNDTAKIIGAGIVGAILGAVLSH